jgi:hypothetical protein
LEAVNMMQRLLFVFLFLQTHSVINAAYCPLASGMYPSDDPTLQSLAASIQPYEENHISIRYSVNSVRRFAGSVSDDLNLEDAGLPIVDITVEERVFFGEQYRVNRRTLERIPNNLSRPKETLEVFESYIEWDSPVDLLVESTRYFQESDAPDFLPDYYSKSTSPPEADNRFESSIDLVDSGVKITEDLRYIFDRNYIRDFLESFSSDAKAECDEAVVAGRSCRRVFVKDGDHTCEFCICPELKFGLLYIKRTYGDKPGYYREFIVKEISSDLSRIITCKNDIYDSVGHAVGSSISSKFSNVVIGRENVAPYFKLKLAESLPDGVKINVQGREQINYEWRNGRVEKVIDNAVLKRLKDARVSNAIN